SCSKDTLVKIWDLDSQLCVQTIIGHRSEVWTLDVNPAGTRLVTGASDNQLRVWALDGNEDEAQEAADGEMSNVSGAAKSVGELAVNGPTSAAARTAKTSREPEAAVAIYIGSVARQGNDRAVQVRFHRRGLLLGIQGAGKAIEVFAVRSEVEAKKRKRRRLQRQREKQEKLRRAAEAAAAAAAARGAPTAAELAAIAAAAATTAASAWGSAGGGAATTDGRHDATVDEGAGRVAAGDELDALAVVRTSHRVRSFDFCHEMSKDGAGTRLLAALHNNALELWSVHGTAIAPAVAGGAGAGTAGVRKRRLSSADAANTALADAAGDGAVATTNGVGAVAVTRAAAVERVAALDLHGHRSDVRAVAISSDEQLVASVSHGLAKVWNARTRHCVRSMAVGFGLCITFTPGDRHLVVGCKDGNLQVVDLASGDIIRDYAAHDGAIWSLDVRPDGRGLATGSADHAIKFWDFEVGGDGGNLALVHTRTLKAADDVLCVRYSRHRQADKLLLAVAVLDGTVKVFFDDSLRFFLSLYGHKLPVMSMDISDDGSLLATGSADKTLKLWGLDFGDCHRSLLAHSDSVMGVRFVPGTHYVFTASKDRTVKYWDADRFSLILELRAHQAEVWALAVATSGSFVVSGGHDRSLRMWERTDEMLFLEEERERRLEDLFEAELDADPRGQPPGLAGVAGGVGADGGGAPAPDGMPTAEVTGESALATRRSIESVKAGERLMEALELAGVEAKAQRRGRRRQRGQPAAAAYRPNPLLLGLTPLRYVLRTLQGIRAAELEQTLLVLPIVLVETLADFLGQLLAAGLEVELSARCAVFLLRTHQAQIVANRAMSGVLDVLRRRLRQRLEGALNVVGTNMAALRLLKRAIEADAAAHVFEADEDCLLKKMRS
ncbi:unnamed protein product, partial [Phaeothamnion confervicola]